MYPREYFDTFWRPDLRNEVFVAMPFDVGLKANWTQIIEPAIRGANLSPHRVDTTAISGSIITEIMDGIAHARLVLGDLSSQATGFPNCNVMYEIGLAHALRQSCEVLLVRGDHNKVLFDLSTIRIHSYDPNNTLQSQMRITELIADSLSEIDHLKALRVQMAIETLDDKCLRLLRREAKKECFGGLPLAMIRAFACKTEADRQKAEGRAPDRNSVEVAGKRAEAASRYDENAVTRLLDVGIIRLQFHQHPKNGMSIYRWTHMGRHVLVKLGYRKNANVPCWK